MADEHRTSKEQFFALYLCSFAPTDQRLHDLGREYQDRCEAFDRTVCTGPIIDGAIMPATPHEMRKISRNAVSIRKEIIFRGEQMGFTRVQIQEAIIHAAE